MNIVGMWYWVEKGEGERGRAKSNEPPLTTSSEEKQEIESSGCLGCGIKHKPIDFSDEQPKELVNQGQTGKPPSILGEFWTTSARDMENSVVQSQGSISSISTSSQALDPHAVVGSTDAHSEFVNHGLLLWSQTRHCWIGDKKPANGGWHVQEPKLSWNASFDSLLGSNKPFPQPVPLSEMVDFLVDIWEEEGMYD
ncbi:hypothetical protein Nepgr_017766 [Nepenthes gracilis]|uniref:Gag1-like clamp domain-containing protein n=1 Tax=Nepenthes gracilis TaxID=150966 RepID=A0AAD3SS23_NEPGR|nr:hypothetical protein Nepgr_017766 [Nepenthes gracilis]